MTSYRRHDAQVSQQWGHGKKSRKFPELPRGSRTDGRGGGGDRKDVRTARRAALATTR